MLSPSAPPDTTNFAFETRFNPVRSWLLVKGDTYFLEDATLAKALHYRVFSEAVDKPIAMGSITQVADATCRTSCSCPRSAGTYHIEATMELTNGRTLGPMKGQFIKKDEAKDARTGGKTSTATWSASCRPTPHSSSRMKAWPAWAAPTTSTPWACPSASSPTAQTSARRQPAW